MARIQRGDDAPLNFPFNLRIVIRYWHINPTYRCTISFNRTSGFSISLNFLTREELLDRSKESNPWVILLIRRSIGFLLKFLKLNVVKLTGESLLIIIDFYFFQRSTKYQDTQKQTLYIQFNELKWDRLFYNRMFYCENFQKKKYLSTKSASLP